MSFKNNVKKVMRGGCKLVTRLQLSFNISKQYLDMSNENAHIILNSIREYKTCNVECVNQLRPEFDLMIVIPAYNVKEYISECMESILNQNTEYTYQVVLVDDGSTDGTQDIVNHYLSDNRVTVIHQKNAGIASARNAGLKVITGRYIMFVDSDDTLLPNAIQNLMSCAYELDADIVEGGSTIYGTSGKIIDTINYEDTVETNKIAKFRGQPWGRVIRSELFINLKYPDGFEFEDSIMAYCIKPMAKKKYNISNVVYGHRRNEESITFTVTSKPSCIDTYYLSMYLWDWYANRFEMTSEFNKQILRQIGLNYQRTTYYGDDVLKAGFCLQREVYLRLFPNRNKLEPSYEMLDAAIRDGCWKQYSLLCRRWKYLK